MKLKKFQDFPGCLKLIHFLVVNHVIDPCEEEQIAEQSVQYKESKVGSIDRFHE
jgi:hypothetical protein